MHTVNYNIDSKIFRAPFYLFFKVKIYLLYGPLVRWGDPRLSSSANRIVTTIHEEDFSSRFPTFLYGTYPP